MTTDNTDLVSRMRGFEIDHEPDGWPAIKMRDVSALCDCIDQLERENELLRSGLIKVSQLLDQFDQKIAIAIAREALSISNKDSRAIDAARAKEST